MIKHEETDPGYLVRKMPDNSWEVSKWGWDTQPLSVYKIMPRGRNDFRCRGPSRGCYAGRCKHIKMVKWTMKHPDRDPFLMLRFE